MLDMVEEKEDKGVRHAFHVQPAKGGQSPTNLRSVPTGTARKGASHKWGLSPFPRRAAGVDSYLANTLAYKGREIPYSTVTAIDFAAGRRWAFSFPGEKPLPPFGPNEIALNSWAADNYTPRWATPSSRLLLQPESVDGQIRQQTVPSVGGHREAGRRGRRSVRHAPGQRHYRSTDDGPLGPALSLRRQTNPPGRREVLVPLRADAQGVRLPKHRSPALGQPLRADPSIRVTAVPSTSVGGLSHSVASPSGRG